MIIVRISGGLGNQMFQYAFYHKLKKLYPDTEIKLDITGYSNIKNDSGLRPLELGVFGLELPSANKADIRRLCGYTRDDTIFDKLLNKVTVRSGRYIEENLSVGYDKAYLGPWGQTVAKNVYLNGYWQCEKYFNDIADEIRALFNFDTSNLNEECRKILAQMEASESVAIHVRRGDYLAEQNARIYGGICTDEYYRHSIDYILDEYPDAELFFFSNDMDWVREHLVEEQGKSGEKLSQTRIHYVTCNTDSPELDMYLMSQAKHNIIANSSFSWWGAWLNKNCSQTVLCPSKWFSHVPADSQICGSWVRIE